MRRRLPLVVGMLALAAASGCGSDAAISGAAADALQPRVAEIRTLAEERRPDDAAARLAELRTVVGTLRAEGEIDDDRAEEVLAAAASVEQQLALVTTTSTTTSPPPTTTSPPPTTSTSPAPSKDQEKGSDDKGRDAKPPKDPKGKG